MHHANYYYGHAHVLARYCGLADAVHPPRVHGYLQHGWNIGDGLAPGVPFVDGSTLLVWSEQTRRRAWSLGRRNVITVGAPFGYLLALRAAATQPPLEQRAGTIFYPFHGWEGQQVVGEHQRLIDEIRDVEPGPVTVCLYWNEYRSRRVRRRYERAGFRVICHGNRGFWWRDHDRGFLERQLGELIRHQRVASNRLSSALWYAAAAGCDVAVYGDPMLLEKADLTFGGEARIRAQWPQLYGHRTDRAECYASARTELGLDLLAPPGELRAHLGWPSPDEELRTTAASEIREVR